jgi:hypothetical protein
LISIKSRDLSEPQLAEIALAIQNRWQIPVFVKMHEIMIIDDEEIEMTPGVITVPLDSRQMEKGFDAILENLDMKRAFTIEKKGRDRFDLNLIDPSGIPSWMIEVNKPTPTPDGMFSCPHCGKLFRTEMERNLHQKLHYII